MRINVVLYPWFSPRFLNPQLVTKVSPSDDIEGINNFDIFVIQVSQLPKSCQQKLESTRILTFFLGGAKAWCWNWGCYSGLWQVEVWLRFNQSINWLQFSCRFIVKKVNEIPVTFRPKSGNDERILQIALDGTQGIAHAKAKVGGKMKLVWIQVPTLMLACLIDYSKSLIVLVEMICFWGHRQLPSSCVVDLKCCSSVVRSNGGSGQCKRSVHLWMHC